MKPQKRYIPLKLIDPSFKSIHTDYHFMYSNLYDFNKIGHLLR